jgi:hypothetical protein
VSAGAQVELNNVRSFYKEAQKSPFKFFPWKTGNMHFKFLPVRCGAGPGTGQGPRGAAGRDRKGQGASAHCERGATVGFISGEGARGR